MPSRHHANPRRPLALLQWALAAILALPLLWLLLRLLVDLPDLHFATLAQHLPALLTRTLLYNLLATLLAFALAIPVALTLARATPARALVIIAILALALLQPPVVYLYGWSQVFRLVGADIPPQSAADIARCIWTLACWLWPIPAAALGLALRSLDQETLDAARLDGAQNRIRAAQLLTPALGAAAITLALALQQFTVFEQTNILVIATELRTVFAIGTLNGDPVALGAAETYTPQHLRISAAALVGLPVVLVVLLLAFAARALLARHALSLGLESAPQRPSRRQPPLAWPALLILLITAALPILALRLSFAHAPDWSNALLTLWPQLSGTLLVSTLVAAICLILGLAAAVVPLPILLITSLLCFLVGGQLLALGAIQLFNQPALDFIYDSAASVVLVHVAMFAWISLLAARPAWQEAWRDIRQAAHSDGATRFQQLLRVILPGTWPWHLSAAAVVFCLSFGEISAVMLLQPQQPQMLMPLLMTWVHLLRYDAMIEGTLIVSAIIVILTVCALALRSLANRPTPPSRTISAFCFPLSAFLLTSCSNPDQPREVWQPPAIRPLIYPRGIAYAPASDEYFVIDRLARIQRISGTGQHLSEWQMPDQTNGRPVGISVGPDANLYIPDTHYYRVMVYTPDGQFLRTWGSQGTGPGQFLYLTDIAFDDAGRVFVSEYGDNDRIQVFDPDGNFLYQFGRFGRGDGEFSRPQSMVIQGNLLYATDAGNHRIVVFSTDGQFVRAMGSAGSDPGQFRFPYGLDQDLDGHLIVTEFGNNRVQKIHRETGQSLGIWGRTGRAPGELAYPWAAVVNRRGHVVIIDSGNNRIQLTRFP